MSLSFRTNGNFIDFVNTDATSLEVETVLMKLHNTSRCIDWGLPEDTTKISFTIDEVKYSNIPISEIDFDGTVMNSQDDFETGITGMFTGLAAGGEGGGGVESVTAAISQEAAMTSGPLTIGVKYQISSYQAGDDFTNVGAASNANGVQFTATGTTPTDWNNESTISPVPVLTIFANSFDEEPTVEVEGLAAGTYSLEIEGAFPIARVFIPGFGDFLSSGTPFMPISNGSDVVGYYTMSPTGANDDYIYLNFIDINGVPKSLNQLMGTGKLYLPDIRVYPA